MPLIKFRDATISKQMIQSERRAAVLNDLSHHVKGLGVYEGVGKRVKGPVVYEGEGKRVSGSDVYKGWVKG